MPNRYYSGATSDHFDGEVFFNPSGTRPKGLKSLLKWQFSEKKAKWPRRFPSAHPPDAPPARVEGHDVRVSFIGHASYLIQARGHALLIDPVYVDRCGPFDLLAPKRVNPPGVPFDALPKIDTVLLTHNHYDHMDTTSLQRLWRRDQFDIVTPLGNDAVLKPHLPDARVHTLDWLGTHKLAGAVQVHALPAQHWSARGARDRSHALWCSFMLRFGDKTVFACGDTGFGDGGIFRDIAQRFPSIDLALLPIGAYEPRWFMRDQHMNPDDAVLAFQILKPKRALGHHWGTWQLTNEAVDAPRADLARALTRQDLPADRFFALQPGAVHTI